MEVNIQEDLNAVNDQLTTLVEELSKINQTREQLVQQVQNLNGIAMYLRGKQGENGTAPVEDLTRTEEYPEAMIQED